ARSAGSARKIPPVPLGCRCGPARWRAASFFTPQPKPPQGAAQRRPAYSRPPGARRQLLSVFVQRTIVPLPHQRPQDRLARRIDPQRATAGMRLGTASAFGARLLAPQVHRRETDANAPGDDCRRQTSFPSQQHPLAQVGRIGLGHPRLLSSEMPPFYPRARCFPNSSENRSRMWTTSTASRSKARVFTKVSSTPTILSPRAVIGTRIEGPPALSVISTPWTATTARIS